MYIVQGEKKILVKIKRETRISLKINCQVCAVSVAEQTPPMYNNRFYYGTDIEWMNNCLSLFVCVCSFNLIAD